MTLEQPAGSVTLVFTDIEGSTRLLRELGQDGYRRALTAHRKCVRSAFGRHRGYEASGEGDAFFYAFASAGHAVQAVTEALEELEAGPIRIRVGVHSGNPGLDPPAYIGLDVHKAARVMAAGHGGQVLLSHETRELLAEQFPVRYLGEFRLKDLAQPERLYQLGSERFPPLRTLFHTNLPVPATSFLGREREVSELVALLRDDVSLLTLTGPGGSGKTRLALQTAASVSEEFPDGVWWVPLASLRDPLLLLPEVARALDLDQPGGEAGEQLKEALTGKRLLLVLDNAEQLLPEAAAGVAQLSDVDGPTLLVTSRERLHLAAEHVYQVPPLAEDDGVALFTARARSVSAGFEAGPAVEELCARLDSLPLALELAAARTLAFSPLEILERLSRRLDLFKGGHDADPRQQTLRAAMEWSYDLLSPEEQRLFARLAVFSGGCTLAAAEQICAADLDALAGLVDKSLLHRSGERYSMLETISEYAAERLDESGEAAMVQGRRTDFYEAFAAEGELGLRGGSVGAWLERIEQELPNLRSAIEYRLHGGEPAAALRMSASLFRFWQARSVLEGRSWLERALASAGGTTAERGKGALRAGDLAFFQGDSERAAALLEEAIELTERAGEAGYHAAALGYAGFVRAEQGDSRGALALARRAEEEASRLGDPWSRAEALEPVAATLMLTGKVDEAGVLWEELLAVRRRLEDELRVLALLCNLGYVAMTRGAYDEARTLLEESLELARQLRDVTGITFALGNLGLVAVLEGRYGDALSLLGEDLRLCASRGDRSRGAEAILGLAAAHAALGNTELAVRLDVIQQAVFDMSRSASWAPGLVDRLRDQLRVAWEQAGAETADPLAGQEGALTMDTAIAELERYD